VVEIFLPVCEFNISCSLVFIPQVRIGSGGEVALEIDVAAAGAESALDEAELRRLCISMVA